ncbi:MAG: hypothetical protein RMY29_001005 [Nostoc sp. CreGUA01]|nr:hypothetical protein [Nostoc sp. CreGUA01]
MSCCRIGNGGDRVSVLKATDAINRRLYKNRFFVETLKLIFMSIAADSGGYQLITVKIVTFANIPGD